MVNQTHIDCPGLFLLAGPTGSGKSTLLEFVKDNYASSIHVGTKFTDRPRRVTDRDWEFNFVERIPSHLQEYAYTAVGRHYAIDISELRSTIKSNLSYLVTCTDPDTIRLLRKAFPAVVVFIYRPLGVREFKQLMARRQVTTDEDLRARQAEVESALTDYARNIGLYTYVVLNTGTLQDLESQATALLEDCGITPGS